MYQLSIKDLRLWVHLGCGEQERFNTQPVSVSIDIDFKVAPKAMISDELDDTICYASIVENVEKLCLSKPFKLIEHLAAQIGKQVDTTLQNQKKLVQNITISLCKLKVPVANVHGAVSFTYTHTPE